MLKRYILSLMKDERSSGADIAVKGVLWFLSRIYAAAIAAVDWAYRSGLRRQRKMPVPVVSVGNITLGGTGKTPLTIFLADHFTAAGKKAAVLTRGYGKDECRMLRDELPDAGVFTGQDRIKSARRAVSGGADILILDDGFQHRRIGRDLNILMLDTLSPFGNGYLFPRGILREPVPSLKRADIFVLTKTDMAPEGRVEDLTRRLEEIAPDKQVVLTRHKPVFMSDVTGGAYSTDDLSGKKVCLLSGIVDPGYFAHLVEELGGVIVVRRDHGDHHRYTQADIRDIFIKCEKQKAEAIIVTRKDYVKIRELDISSIEEKLFVLNIVIDIVKGKENFVAGLNSVVPGQGA